MTDQVFQVGLTAAEIELLTGLAMAGKLAYVMQWKTSPSYDPKILEERDSQAKELNSLIDKFSKYLQEIQNLTSESDSSIHKE